MIAHPVGASYAKFLSDLDQTGRCVALEYLSPDVFQNLSLSFGEGLGHGRFLELV